MVPHGNSGLDSLFGTSPLPRCLLSVLQLTSSPLLEVCANLRCGAPYAALRAFHALPPVHQALAASKGRALRELRRLAATHLLHGLADQPEVEHRCISAPDAALQLGFYSSGPGAAAGGALQGCDGVRECSLMMRVLDASGRMQQQAQARFLPPRPVGAVARRGWTHGPERACMTGNRVGQTLAERNQETAAQVEPEPGRQRAELPPDDRSCPAVYSQQLHCLYRVQAAKS